MRSIPLQQHKSLKRLSIDRLESGKKNPLKDLVAVEQALEIQLISGYHDQRIRSSYLLSMCSPGNEQELAIGILFHQGIIQKMTDVLDVQFCPFTQTSPNSKVLVVELDPELEIDPEHIKPRHLSNSACGLCGSNPESLTNQSDAPKFPISWSFSANDLSQLPELLFEHQAIFQLTGGLHAAAFISLSGEILEYREDVGRHNALDKLIGSNLMNASFSFDEGILLMSSRASFELVDKAIKAGIHFLAVIGAPSSLAIDLANLSNLTLVGFLKKETCNIYAAPERIELNTNEYV